MSSLDLVRLATRVSSMLSTTRPGQHQADLREIHGHLLQLAGAPTREAELLDLLSEARAAMGSAPAQDAERMFDLLQRVDSQLGPRNR